MTITDRTAQGNPGAGAHPSIAPPPLTLKNNGQPIENGHAEASGPPWTSDFHGDFGPRWSRMDKYLKLPENRNTELSEIYIVAAEGWA